MVLQDFRESLDGFIDRHKTKAADYGPVRETFISMTNDLVWLLSEFDGTSGPTEFNTALVMTSDSLEIKYEYVL